ncbi:MAG: N-acetylmuramoyl-L-alanine amidase [Akkermansia sp.]
MKIALCIGHCPQDGGAVTTDGKWSEFSFWSAHLGAFVKALEGLGHEAVVTNRAEAGGGSPSFAAKACNETGADLAIEFHFNSADSRSATGTETLYWHKSVKGRRAAELVNDAMCEVLRLPDRGVKAVCSAGDRAGNFFLKTRMPAILVEPCFAGSNVSDCDRLCERVSRVAVAVAKAVNEYSNIK